MEPLVRIRAVAAPYGESDIDTDRIIPARFLSTPRSPGSHAPLGFHDARFRADGSEEPRFFLNVPAYRGARILVAGENFGCGSSREAAVWCLVDLGFRAIIAPSFGDIFAGNALKNGLLPIRLPAAVVAGLLARLEATPGSEIAIDVDAQTVTAGDGESHRFEIDAFRKHCLMRGVDDVDLTLELVERIEAFEAARRRDLPWVFSPPGTGGS